MGCQESKTLKTMKAASGIYTPKLLLHFIEEDNLEDLRVAIEHNCPTDENVAAMAPNLEILKLLYSKNPKIDHRVIDSAIKRKDIPAVEWALDKNCEYSNDQLIAVTSSGEPLMIRQFTIHHGAKDWPEKALFNIIDRGLREEFPHNYNEDEDCAIHAGYVGAMNFKTIFSKLHMAIGAARACNRKHLEELVSMLNSTKISDVDSVDGGTTVLSLNIRRDDDTKSNISMMTQSQQHKRPAKPKRLVNLELLAVEASCDIECLIFMKEILAENFPLQRCAKAACQKGAIASLRYMIAYCGLRPSIDLLIAGVAYTEIIDFWTREKSIKPTALVLNAAAAAGAMEAFKHLVDQKIPITKETYTCAAIAGQVGILTIIQEISPLTKPDSSIIDKVAREGQLSVLQYIYGTWPAQQLVCSGKPCDSAIQAKVDAWPCVEFLFGKGQKIGISTMLIAARMGKVEYGKNLRELGCEYDATVPAAAASENRIDFLKWLIEDGCPMDQRTLIEAENNSAFECYKLAYDAGCACQPSLYEEKVLLKRAEEEGCDSTEILNSGDDCRRALISFMRMKKNDPEYIVDWVSIAKSGFVICLQNAAYNATQSPSDVIIPIYAENGSIDSLRFCLGKRKCPSTTLEVASEKASNAGRADCLELLIKNGAIVTEEIVSKCIESRNIDTIRIALKYSKYQIITSEQMGNAASSGDLQIVEILLSRGPQLNESIFDSACTSGNVLILTALKAAGCPIGNNASTNAAFSGNPVCRRRLSMCPDKHLGVFELFKTVFVNGYKSEGFQTFHFNLIMDNIAERV